MTLEEIAALLSEHVDVDPSTITEETTFDSLGIDSLETVEIVMELEEKLDRELELVDKISTVGELLEFIQK